MNNSISAVWFLYGHWNVSWGPAGAEHTVWLQDVTGGEMRTDVCPGTSDSHLAHLLYFSQAKSPAWGPLLGQAGPAPNGVNAVTEARFSLLLSGGFPGELLPSNTDW